VRKQIVENVKTPGHVGIQTTILASTSTSLCWSRPRSRPRTFGLGCCCETQL